MLWLDRLLALLWIFLIISVNITTRLSYIFIQNIDLHLIWRACLIIIFCGGHPVVYFTRVDPWLIDTLFYHWLVARIKSVGTSRTQIWYICAVFTPWWWRVTTHLDKFRGSCGSIDFESCFEPLISFWKNTIHYRPGYPRIHWSQQRWFLGSFHNFWSHIWLSSSLLGRHLSIHRICLSWENLVILLRSCCLIVGDSFVTTFDLIISMRKNFLISRLDLLGSWNCCCNFCSHVRVTCCSSLILSSWLNSFVFMNRR